jgi:hypothetical protein
METFKTLGSEGSENGDNDDGFRRVGRFFDFEQLLAIKDVKKSIVDVLNLINLEWCDFYLKKNEVTCFAPKSGEYGERGY